jgi:hypothetical protein
VPTPTPALPIEYIDKYLGLCPSSESGLKWIARPPRSRISVGSVAGSRTHEGYWRVKCNGQECRAHRIVFYLATGTDPEGVEVDHIDRDRSNNDPLNLRLAKPSLQQRNRGKQKNSTSQYKGVCLQGGRWAARCCIWLPDGTLSKTRHHGKYDTEEEAYAEVLRHRPEWA